MIRLLLTAESSAANSGKSSRRKGLIAEEGRIPQVPGQHDAQADPHQERPDDEGAADPKITVEP
jgi:hypothetical protein